MNRPSPRWNAIAPIALILFFLFLTFPVEAQLAYSPAGLNFGNVAVGSTSTLPGVFVNQGTSSVTIRSVSVNGTGFAIGGMTLPLTLSPGQSANYSASFAPQSAGTAVGTCYFNVKTSMSKRSRSATGSSTSTSVPMSGTGTVLSGQLAANPTSVSFGTVAVGASVFERHHLRAAQVPRAALRPAWDRECHCHITRIRNRRCRMRSAPWDSCALHAAELQVDPHRIGVLGFSAGGHLVAAISNEYWRTRPTRRSTAPTV